MLVRRRTAWIRQHVAIMNHQSRLLVLMKHQCCLFQTPHLFVNNSHCVSFKFKFPGFSLYLGMEPLLQTLIFGTLSQSNWAMDTLKWWYLPFEYIIFWWNEAQRSTPTQGLHQPAGMFPRALLYPVGDWIGNMIGTQPWSVGAHRWEWKGRYWKGGKSSRLALSPQG